ncbi:MAG: helix-turn-helix transcriptional regulator [Pirellulales bacterium]
MATTKNLAEAIRRKLARDPDLAQRVERERFKANVGSEIFLAREQAGLTQQALAERAGMHQSVIARLEDADYDGHSLRTLERIASALEKRLEVRFVGRSYSIGETVTAELATEAPTWLLEPEEWSPTITKSLSRTLVA